MMYCEGMLHTRVTNKARQQTPNVLNTGGRYNLAGETSFFFFQAEDGIRDLTVTGVDVCSSDLGWPAGCHCRGVEMPPDGRHLRARTATAPRTVRAWLGALAAALVVSACVGQPAGPPSLPPPFNHLAVATTMRTYHPPSSVGLPISVVQVSSSTYLLCDYLNVYRVARTATGYSVTTLARPAVTVWTPAGLDFKGGTLYVANYRGRDVLQLQLEGDQLILIRQIASPQLHEPENLWAE